MTSERYEGKVIWFVRGWGFILWSINGEQQKDLFVHYSDIVSKGFKTLRKDQKVSFTTGFNQKGVIKATEVTVID